MFKLKEESHISHSKSKPRNVKLSEKCMLEAEMGSKLHLLHELESCECKGKVLEEN